VKEPVKKVVKEVVSSPVSAPVGRGDCFGGFYCGVGHECNGFFP
jgi:hypothetical protein